MCCFCFCTVGGGLTVDIVCFIELKPEGGATEGCFGGLGFNGFDHGISVN